ncbi:MAG: GFA family protein, partial [Alphaproteobacteria bacterium]
ENHSASSMCHCLDCQRRTGSLFGIAAFFERSAVKLVDDTSKIFTRNSVLGKLVTFHFCPECGSTVFWEPERMPKLIGVAVGAFGDPSFPQPEQSVFTTRKHAWFGLPDEVRAFAAMPPSRNG